MFFILSKILSFLIDPFFWILILFALALFAKKTYRRKKYFILGLIFFIFFSNGFLYKIINDQWEVEFNDQKAKYDYGILLGGMISLNSTEDNVQFLSNNDRLLNTIELYHNNTIDKILITGASGSLTSEMKESTILKKYLEKTGIASRNILIEEESKNTYENALFCDKLLSEKHPKKNIHCLIITSKYHMRRSMACFYNTSLKTDPFIKKADKSHFDLEGIVIPQSHILFKWKVLLHEIVGYYTYKLVGYI